MTNSALFAGPSFGFKRGATIPGIADLPDELKSTALASLQSSVGAQDKPTGVKFKNEAQRNNIRHCGQGYVAAIVSGAEVDAFLTFSKSDAEAIAEVKAGIKASIGGIFSVSGSFAQNQQSVERNESSEVSVYRSGGRAAAIAYDLDGLRTSLQQLPVDAAAHPKPIKMAIMPYSKLDDSPLSGGRRAGDLLDSIAAFFLVSDVVQETGSIIDWYRSYDSDGIATDPAADRSRLVPLFLNPLSAYVMMNDDALALNRQMSKALALCQASLQQSNLVQDGAAEVVPPTVQEGEPTSQAAARAEVSTKQKQVLTAPPKPETEETPLEFLTKQLPSNASADMAKRLGALTESAGAKAAQDLEKLFLTFEEIFKEDDDLALARARVEVALADADQKPQKDDVTKLTDAAEKQLAACNTNNGYLAAALQEALELSQNFLAIRPIFWSDLGRYHQSRIWQLFTAGSLPKDQTTEILVQTVTPDLHDFHNTMVAKRFKRDICARDLNHPVCGPEFQNAYKGPNLTPATVVLAGIIAGLEKGVE